MHYIINTKYTNEAWIRCLRKIIEEGRIINDNNKNGKIKEIMNVFISITNPLYQGKVTNDFVDLGMINWMENNFFKKKPISGWDYSYAQRLFDYNKIDQIKLVIKCLKDNPLAKSATIVLMKPGFDAKHVPCITTLDFKIRDRKLVLTSFLRSQDIYKKMYADILCLAKIQKNVADRLHVKIGSLCLDVVSAHIYEEDIKKAKEVLKKIKNENPFCFRK